MTTIEARQADCEVRRDYRIRFLTPAFLGGADQSSEWRTPPFKAALRHWWRVVKANELLWEGSPAERLHGQVREAEGRLLGHAWLKHGKEHWAARSRVRIQIREVGPDGVPKGGAEIYDPPVLGAQVTSKGAPPVEAAQYLGFGPITRFTKEERKRGKRGLKLSAQPAFAADATTCMRIALPSGHTDEIERTLTLIHWFGTVGGRSRNGWGSVHLASDDHLLPDLPSGFADLAPAITRPWQDCLALDWPHAIGRDERGPLVWMGPATSWRQALGGLGQVRRDLRVAADSAGKGAVLSGTHLLGYPVTKHDVKTWGSDARLATQLRFKIIQGVGAGEDAYRPLVFHLPCAVPASLRSKLDPADRAWLDQNEAAVWQAVHRTLDRNGTLDDNRQLHRLEA